MVEALPLPQPVVALVASRRTQWTSEKPRAPELEHRVDIVIHHQGSI